MTELKLVLSAANATNPAFAAAKGNIKDLDSAAGTATKSTGGLGKALGSAASIAGGFVVAQGLMQLPGMFSAIGQQGAAMELQLKKANTVFGEQIGVVQSWAAANAQSMGLTKNEAVNLAASMADLLIPMGMTREAAAEMSTQTIGLAGALSEWSGGQVSASQAADILSKAYLGERDGLKALGISISEADVSGRLLEKGQQDLTGAALQQAQALATQELIFEKSTDAQAAFATGAGTAARAQSENTARIKEAKEELAQGLAPAYAAVMQAVSTALPVLIDFGTKAAAGLKEAGQWAAKFVSAFSEGDWSQIGTMLSGLATTIGTALLDAGKALVSWIAPKIPEMLLELGKLIIRLDTWFYTEALPAIVTALAGWGLEFAKWIGPQIGPMIEKLGELLTAGTDWVVNTGVPELAAKLGEWGKEFVAWVGPAIPPLLVEAGELLLKLGDWMLNTALPAIITNVQAWGQEFVTWVAPRIGALLLEAGKLQTQLTTWMITDALPAIIGKLAEWGKAFVGWIATDVLPKLPGALAEILSTMGTWVGTATQWALRELRTVGAAIIQGMKDGVSAAAQGLADVVIAAATGALNAAKAALGIGSPSHEFWLIGKASMEGWGDGITDNASIVVDAVNAVAGASLAVAAGASMTASGAGVPGSPPPQQTQGVPGGGQGSADDKADMAVAQRMAGQFNLMPWESMTNMLTNSMPLHGNWMVGVPNAEQKAQMEARSAQMASSEAVGLFFQRLQFGGLTKGETLAAFKPYMDAMNKHFGEQGTIQEQQLEEARGTNKRLDRLEALLADGGDVIMDGEKVGRVITPTISRQQGAQSEVWGL